jgi:uncharacterized membrane protein
MESMESVLQGALQRLWEVERRVDALAAEVRLLRGMKAPPETPAAVPALPTEPAAPPSEPSGAPVFEPAFSSIGARSTAAPEIPRRVEPQPPSPPPVPAQSQDWEAALGGNWLNKIGVLVLVVGIALALGYSFKYLGPAGIDTICVAGSVAMLAAGVTLERRERYRTFARGLLGGGWAALYFTVYAMQSLPAARVLYNPWAGALLLLAVAIGIIAHSLRYGSQAVTGVAYFTAFVALAITQVTSLSVGALVPLAASLLYIARRFSWHKMALFGLLATYLTCASRPDTGAPLWQVQALFAVYWLLFEGFDLLCADPFLLPLNALGFLSLSLFKWQTLAPHQVWAFLAVMAAAYVAGALLRLPRAGAGVEEAGRWQPAITLAAALAAAAILLKLEHQWIVLALLVEAELLYLAGWRLRSAYLRYVAAPLFALAVFHLLAFELTELPVSAWTPVAALGAVLLYANCFLRAADALYGYAGIGMVALVAGYVAPRGYRAIWWLLLGLAPFAWGWWRRLLHFRVQGYLLVALGLMDVAVNPSSLSLAIAAIVSYALAFCSDVFSERFDPRERDSVRLLGSLAGTATLAAWLWRVVPPQNLAPALALFALALFYAGRGRVEVQWQSYAIALLAFAGCWYYNLDRGLQPALSGVAAIACFVAAEMLAERGGRPRLYYSLLATALTTVLLYYQVSGSMRTVAWGIQGLALLGSGFPLRDRVLRVSGLALLLACILKLFLWDLRHLETLPRILSFILLGLFLVGVSWVYTRFRDRVAQYL